ncbi:hypothetical protein FQN54_003910 [Arachnomyces sp. PD_36]|nr:hypothetical protein FQN54_003910 [Arachnomyces sp. PD_36]
MLDSATKKPPSRGGKRVKTGCKTCKIRRVKCDESRPSCHRCVSTGRICDGYGVWGGGGTPYGQPQPPRALSSYCTPVPAGSLTSKEQISFEWFMEKTTKKFAGFFSSDFWETLVFQASAREPAVRHAVVALAAAHRFDGEYSPYTSPATSCFDSERFTLQQYNKAIRHLRVGTGASKHALHVTLITCMLFVTLEYLRGQYKMGSAHLRSGIQILSHISAPKERLAMSPSILSPAEDFAHNALIDSYARLTIQSAMFGHLPAHLCVVTRDLQANALPDEFSSIVDARQSLDDLLNRAHYLQRQLHILLTHSTSKTPYIELEFFETRRQILTDLALWRKASNATLTRLKTENASFRATQRYSLLDTYYEMTVIMATVCLPSAGEMSFDAHTANFTTIIRQFHDMWTSWARLNNGTRELSQLLHESQRDRHSFTVESGFIPPVYYTALKCRVPRLRRVAIRMLRSVPHREGLWDGPLLADVLEEVIRIEEGGLSVEDCAGEYFFDGNLGGPSVDPLSRIVDVSVHLPERIDGDAFMTYRKQVGEGLWEEFKQGVRPGVLRGRINLATMKCTDM